MKKIAYDRLLDYQSKLIHEATRARLMSYCPYSNFSVGAALQSADGFIITGTNYENTAYTGIHAEQAALATANTLGYRAFKAIAIIGGKQGKRIVDAVTPCGNCRQLLFEACQRSSKNIEVITHSLKKKEVIISSINELLPLAFVSNDKIWNVF